MIGCVDVDYRGEQGPAVASCVVFESWEAPASLEEHVAVVPSVAAYVPGQFYRRELPCVLQALARSQAPFDAIIVDGHVWLDERGAPGLGAHLHRTLRERAPVVGIAKTRYRDRDVGRQVFRGSSRRPLFVTAVGMDVDVAADRVRRMHGAYRRPTLVTRADQLCRKVG